MAKLKHYGKVSAGLALGKITLNDKPNPGDIQLLRPQDLHTNILLGKETLAPLDYLALEEGLRSRIKTEHYLRENDIVLTARGTSFHVAMIETLAPNQHIIMSNNMLCLRPDIEHPHAITIYLNSDDFKDNVIAKEFPKMLGLSVRWLNEVVFSLPAAHKRAAFADLLKSYQTQIDAIETYRQAFQTRMEAALFDHLNQLEKDND